MYKKIQVIAETAILIALSLVLDIIGGAYFSFAWLNGGSISIAMIPIIIIAYRFGTQQGLMAGFLVGIIQLMWSENYGPLSVVLDYMVAYTVVGLAGLFRKQLQGPNNTIRIVPFLLSLLVVFVLRLTTHTISGIVVFEVPFWGSLTYNGSYLGISIVACGLILWLLMEKAQKIVFIEE